MREEEYWDSLAERYDCLYSSPWSRSEDEVLGQILGRLVTLTSGRSALDIGCGTGLGYELLRAHASVRYTGLDISLGMLSQLKRKFAPACVVHGSADDLSNLFRCEQFDLVISINVAASFASSPRNLLQAIHGILVPGGAAYVSFLNRWSLRRLLRCRFAMREAYLTRGDKRGFDPVQAVTVTWRELGSISRRAGLKLVEVGWRSVLGGVYEGPMAIALEKIAHRVAARAGHEVYAIVQKPV